jgi:hypothetical protein
MIKELTVEFNNLAYQFDWWSFQNRHSIGARLRVALIHKKRRQETRSRRLFLLFRLPDDFRNGDDYLRIREDWREYCAQTACLRIQLL